MDSINERKIYQLIADSVEDDKCSQYFLLTPKVCAHKFLDLITRYVNPDLVEVEIISLFRSLQLSTGMVTLIFPPYA